MGISGRSLQIGQDAITDYNGPGPLTRVTIIDADRTRKHGHSQSGIRFRVTPVLKHGTEQTWYDADWFEPIPKTGNMFDQNEETERCAGVGSAEDGWREGCDDCLRRTQPPLNNRVSWCVPPPIIAFECELRIDPTPEGTKRHKEAN